MYMVSDDVRKEKGERGERREERRGEREREAERENFVMTMDMRWMGHDGSLGSTQTLDEM